jgi:hypothetical protein
MSKLYNPDPELDLFYRSDTCTVYLIHFYQPIYHAQHYIGSTEDLDRRLQEHQRVWPLYRIDGPTLGALVHHVPDPILAELEPLCGKNFRRKHTFLAAIHNRIGIETLDQALLRAARKHSSNGLVMRANQLKIHWAVARTWHANRDFEMYLKRQKNTRRYCPVCQGETAPDEELPF